MHLKEEVLSLYNKGHSILFISKETNITYYKVHKIIKNNVGEIRKNDFYSKKYTYNRDYFEYIDSSEKAYWLGFIYADGYITQDYFGITISAKDINHLEKLKKVMQANIEIKTYLASKKTSYSNNLYCRFIIKDKKIVSDLIRHGVVYNKTNILQFPSTINDKYLYDFIRGYFDGDGCYTQSNKGTYKIKFCGTEALLNGIKKHINKPSLKLSYRNNCYQLEIGGKKQLEKLINNMYKNKTINSFLDRKYNAIVESNFVVLSGNG